MTEPAIPGVPASETPDAGRPEPAGVEFPPPPKPDQQAPEPVSATGAPSGAPARIRAQAGTRLTTSLGTPLRDTDHSLKAGERGPSLLQDHHLREKITHFDHERIPERVVHARGAAAHGVFRSYGNAASLTRASFLAPDTETPVFVRFSTVLGFRGSADTARDTRGFATKFYTDEGVFDLVGNNMPVFFIQDAIKFPDVIHAGKPHPDREIPQAQSAHDTFWDFVSLHTEATHHVLWNMSDRGIPRSYRMMEGFGVHTFRLVNEAGQTSLVKFHWKPVLGVHSLVWEEAQLLAGFDPDFHRRDLFDAIEAGAYPEWELGVQVMPDNPEQTFEGIDLLDPTKLVPEELCPVQLIGRLTLYRNPTNFFAETEQVAFHVGNLVSGIDVTDDPLMQGRLFSYLDTQLTRLGGPNFNQLPINRPHSPVNDMLRDGFHQHAVHEGVAPYQPNSLHGGCPFALGSAPDAFIEVPQPITGTKVRQAPASFADHFSQARLFYRSLSELEQRHLAEAITFELSKCYETPIRERELQVLANVDTGLAEAVAAKLGLAPPAPTEQVPDVAVSPALAQIGQQWPTAGRTIGLLVGRNCDAAQVAQLQQQILDAGMVGLIIAPVGGRLPDGTPAQRTYQTARSVEYDALVLADGIGAEPADARLSILLSETYRHGKAMLGWGDADQVFQALSYLPADGLTVLAGAADVLAAAQDQLSQHRDWDRLASL
ncbi:MAG TPA: catalase [Jatrophihabitans sp.]|nr:catalase [Jatrophihabitans sp.]